MQRVRYKFSVASISALLSVALLLLQLCGTICEFSYCRTSPTTPIAGQERNPGHCHQVHQAQSDADKQTPQSPKNRQHKCADHEMAVRLPLMNSLPVAIVSLFSHPIVFESVRLSLFNRFVISNTSIWDSHRAPPRISQRSILRI